MNIFKQFWISLYSPKDIAKFRFQKIGKTILYVFLLVFLSSLPTIVFTSTGINNGVKSFQEALQNELPDFEIKEGTLYTDSSELFIYQANNFSIYLDSTGTLTTEDVLNKESNAFLLLPSEFVIITSGTAQAQPYSMFENFTLSNTDILNFLDNTKGLLNIFIIIFAIIMYIFTAGIQFIEISFLALIVLLFGNITGRKIQYRHYWRLITYCLTLPIVFFTLMNFIQVQVIGGIYVKWGTALVMFYLALKEIPKQKVKNQS